VNRKLYFDSQLGFNTYALMENGVLTEYVMEPDDIGEAVGNVYKGRVTDVLNGMQAAFIDCGLERHCYISASDVNSADGVTLGDAGQPLNLKVGDEILVQITKTAVGKKGAKVTTNLSFVGKYIVYMPNTPFVGVSHRIDDDELRDTLIFTAKKCIDEGEGLIVRTAAPYAHLAAKTAELKYFRGLYKNLLSRFENAPCGELLYSNSPLFMRVLRDIMLDMGDEIYVGSEKLYGIIKSVVEGYGEEARAKVIYRDEHEDLMYASGVSEEFLKTLKPKAELKNGAYIVIDKTEALTAIDVNTGKYTGETNLEDTVFATNLLAVREIVRQVRLRNLGGIFVVDFIDMTNEAHKKAVVSELEFELRKDKGKCRVLPMSKFGLVEFTRKRSGPPGCEIKTRPCEACDGTGTLRSFESLTNEFRAKLLHVLYSGAATVCVDVNFNLANYVLGHAALKENLQRLYPQARVYVVGHRTYKESTMSVRRVDVPNFTLPEGTMLLY